MDSFCLELETSKLQLNMYTRDRENAKDVRSGFNKKYVAVVVAFGSIIRRVIMLADTPTALPREPNTTELLKQSSCQCICRVHSPRGLYTLPLRLLI